MQRGDCSDGTKSTVSNASCGIRTYRGTGSTRVPLQNTRHKTCNDSGNPHFRRLTCGYVLSAPLYASDAETLDACPVACVLSPVVTQDENARKNVYTSNKCTHTYVISRAHPHAAGPHGPPRVRRRHTLRGRIAAPRHTLGALLTSRRVAGYSGSRIPIRVTTVGVLCY